MILNPCERLRLEANRLSTRNTTFADTRRHTENRL
jgi:hypothetical protein